MMKAKQKNVRVFEIEYESEDEVLYEYLEKNRVLLCEFLLLFKTPPSQELTRYLQSNHFIFAPLCGSAPRERETKSDTQTAPQSTQEEPQSDAPKTSSTLLIHRTIRSGEVITNEGDITLFGRLNSGARIKCAGNAHLFGVIDGVVECEGEYMILSTIGQGSVLFGGMILDSKEFDGKPKKVFHSNDEIVIGAIG